MYIHSLGKGKVTLNNKGQAVAKHERGRHGGALLDAAHGCHCIEMYQNGLAVGWVRQFALCFSFDHCSLHSVVGIFAYLMSLKVEIFSTI